MYLYSRKINIIVSRIALPGGRVLIHLSNQVRDTDREIEYESAGDFPFPAYRMKNLQHKELAFCVFIHRTRFN